MKSGVDAQGKPIMRPFAIGDRVISTEGRFAGRVSEVNSDYGIVIERAPAGGQIGVTTYNFVEDPAPVPMGSGPMPTDGPRGPYGGRVLPGGPMVGERPPAEPVRVAKVRGKKAPPPEPNQGSLF